MIKFGVFLPFYAFGLEKADYRSFDMIKALAVECERLGYHSVWIDDHLMYGKTPILECWTVLSALSTVTKQIRLGALALCNAFRNPAVLAKMATTLDVISGGRLELGLGTGSQKDEHIAYGLSFPNLEKRAERLMESVEIMKRMWTGDEVVYKGRYYRVGKAFCQPKPVQKPHPPITVGGSSEHVLKVAAKHADRCDLGALPLKNYKSKVRIFKEYCRVFDRNSLEMEMTSWLGGTIFIAEDEKGLAEKILKWKPRNTSVKTFRRLNCVGTPEDFIQKIQKNLSFGVNFFMLYFGDLPDGSSLKVFAEKIMKEF